MAKSKKGNNVYIPDHTTHRGAVKYPLGHPPPQMRVSPGNQVTFGGVAPHTAQGTGPAPRRLALDGQPAKIYIADRSNHRIRDVFNGPQPALLARLAGNGGAPSPGGRAPNRHRKLACGYPYGVWNDVNGICSLPTQAQSLRWGSKCKLPSDYIRQAKRWGRWILGLRFGLPSPPSLEALSDSRASGEVFRGEFHCYRTPGTFRIRGGSNGVHRCSAASTTSAGSIGFRGECGSNHPDQTGHLTRRWALLDYRQTFHPGRCTSQTKNCPFPVCPHPPLHHCLCYFAPKSGGR